MVKDLVSIVVPTYNDAPYLKDAITDLLKQTYKNIEIIIVNDGSTDETSTILDLLKNENSNITVINKQNGGTGSALNAGFAVARGEFGTWVSSDDRKKEFLIERLVNFLKSNRDVEYVVSAFYSQYLKSNFRSWIPVENTVKGYILNQGGVSDQPCTNKSVIVDNWIPMNMIQCHSGVNYLFTMRLKNECGPYIEIPGEDFNMAVRMGMKTRVGYIDEILGQHNNPIDSLSMQDRNCVLEAVHITRDLINNKYKHWNLEKIPKIAHFYWGSDKMSFMRYMTILSFKKQNPDWSVYLYVPEELNLGKTWNSEHALDNQEYKGEDYFEKLKNDIALKIISVDFSKTNMKQGSEVHRSDYLRWAVLTITGGVWLDMDILFLKPLSSIYFNNTLNARVDTITSFDERHINLFRHHEMSIGVLFSSGLNNPFYASIFTAAKNETNYGSYQSHGTTLLEKIGINNETYQNKFDNLNFHNLDYRTFYLKDYLNLDEIYEKNILDELLADDKFIGIHWYGGAELTLKYNNLLNHKTYKEYNNTIAQGIARILEVN